VSGSRNIGRSTANGCLCATCGFSQSPLSCAFHSFTGPITKSAGRGVQKVMTFGFVDVTVLSYIVGDEYFRRHFSSEITHF
jgi:hypothetical protein